MKSRLFVDHVLIHARAGKGGDGSPHFRREKYVPRGGPDGGDGGRGGHVVLKGSNHVSSLLSLYFDPNVTAEDGQNGQFQKMSGRRGRDKVVLVPCGTEVFRADTGELIADVVEHNQEVIVCRGGRGGLGNVHFKSSVNQAPEQHTPGRPGEELDLRLELKTIADAGLLGFPNAGKSSLLTAVSAARPKIASYPFTTLNPIVGSIEYPDFSQLRVADIPGIIEGAASGVGLGIYFLKHLARSRVIVYILDMAGTDNRQPWNDYAVLRREIEQHDPDLLKRPFLVLANKMDCDVSAENLERFVAETGTEPIPMSAVTPGDPGVKAFKQRLWDILKPAPKGSWRKAASEVAIPGASFLDMGFKKKKKHTAKRRRV